MIFLYSYLHHNLSLSNPIFLNIDPVLVKAKLWNNGFDYYQNLKIFHVFILHKIGKENVFDDILERKKAFLDYKNKELKKAKNWDFFKGVSPWFLSKICNFLPCWIHT